MLDECAVRAVRKIRRPKIHDGRLLITYSTSGTRQLKVTGYRRVGVAYVKTFKTLAAFHYVSVSCRTFRVMHLVACMDCFIYKNRHG